jgi:hypothetical protein
MFYPGLIEQYPITFTDIIWRNGTFTVFHIDIYPNRNMSDIFPNHNISDSGNVCSGVEEVKTNSEPAILLPEEHTGRTE